MENDMVSVELDYEMWCSFLADTNIPLEKYTEYTTSHNLIKVEFTNKEDAALCIEYIGSFNPEEKLSPLAPVPDAWTPETLPDMKLAEIVRIAGGKTARKKELDAQLKEVKGDLEILNFHILKRLKEEDQTKGKYGDFTVSISSHIQPQPDPDKWEEIYQWAVDNGRTDMLMKRVNAAPFREALESEDIENPPSDLIGTSTRETINLRQL